MLILVTPFSPPARSPLLAPDIADTSGIAIVGGERSDKR
jgi:hypothetical protein